ncbi:3D domain-containing protein [Ornithinibacillus sp. JPR2-1]|uniref:3D domain-containing protein n=1 Tax=Ornithinibacillus sp. JPR2-1 TaxID=2094019 RepID=UPI0031DB5C98
MNFIALLISLLPLCVGYDGADISLYEEVYMEAEETKVSSQVVQNDTYLGEFTITAYTAGVESTGKHPGHPDYGKTASGTYVEEGRTIAADWDVLPSGTKVKIEGLEGTYIVEDRGGAITGMKLDIYMESLSDATAWGRQERAVWIIEEE